MDCWTLSEPLLPGREAKSSTRRWRERQQSRTLTWLCHGRPRSSRRSTIQGSSRRGSCSWTNLNDMWVIEVIKTTEIVSSERYINNSTKFTYWKETNQPILTKWKENENLTSKKRNHLTFFRLREKGKRNGKSNYSCWFLAKSWAIENRNYHLK